MFLLQWFDNFMSDNFTYFGPVNHRTMAQIEWPVDGILKHRFWRGLRRSQIENCVYFGIFQHKFVGKYRSHFSKICQDCVISVRHYMPFLQICYDWTLGNFAFYYIVLPLKGIKYKMQNFPWFSQSLAIAFSLAKLPSFRHLPIMSPKIKDQIKLKISLIII